jgi:hypothetical protein
MLVSMWLDDAEDAAGAELIGCLTETGEPCIKATTVLPFAAGVQRLIDVEFEDGHRYYTKEAHVADLADRLSAITLQFVEEVVDHVQVAGPGHLVVDVLAHRQVQHPEAERGEHHRPPGRHHHPRG